MRVGRATILVLVASSALACLSEGVDSSRVAEWTVEPQPSISIGELAGDPAHLFEAVTAARFTEDLRIVIADAGSALIRVFDTSGTFLAEMGGEGEGPGEFQQLRDIWIVSPDTIGAWDSGLSRLTYFESTGRLVRTVNLDAGAAGPGMGSLDVFVAAMPNGTVAIGSLAFGSSAGVGADKIAVETFGTSGGHRQRVLETTGLVRAQFGESRAPIPFSPYPRFASHGSTIYETNGTDSTVRLWDGGARRTVEFPAANHDVDLAWGELEATLRERENEFFLPLLPLAARSDPIPSLSGLLVDDLGRIWAKRFDAATDALWLASGPKAFGGTWWVADPNGTLVASVTVPSTLSPLQVVGDRLLAVSVDALGVERVAVHAIRN